MTDLLVALALIEFALGALAIWRGYRAEYLTLFVLALLLRPQEVELGSLPLAVGGAIGYVASLVWRLIQLPRKWQARAQVWLLRHGLDLSFAIWPRTPVLIAGAVGLMLVTPSAFSAALTVLLALATIAGSWEWRRGRGGPHLPAMTIAALALVLAIAGLFTLLLGGVVWFDPTLSREVVSQLVSVQIALGLLPLTVLTVAAPLVTGAAGAAAAQVLPFRWSITALGVLLFSIALDLRLLGSAIQPGDTEWAAVLAGAAIGLALIVSARIVRYLQPEYVAHALVARLNRPWLDELERLYENHYAPWLVPDRFPPIERLLYIAATREADIRLFNGTLRALLDRLHSLAQNNGIARADLSLDEYLARRFAALIEDTGRQGKGWVLEVLISFRRELADRIGRHDSKALTGAQYMERTRHGEGPAGMRLYGRILDAAIRFGVPEVGERAVGQIRHHAEGLLGALPDPTGVWEIDPAAPVAFDAQAPATKARGGLEDLLEKLRRWADDAMSHDRFDIARAIAYALSWLTLAARGLASPHWARWLARHASLDAHFVARTGLAHGQLAYEVPSPFAALDPANASHRETMEAIAYWTPLTVAMCAPVATYGLVTEAAMLAVGWLHVHEYLPQASVLAAALDHVREHQATLPPSDERALVIRECVGRLQQMRAAAGARADEFDQMRVTALINLRHELNPAPSDSTLTTLISRTLAD
jgi:hypothetical protein